MGISNAHGVLGRGALDNAASALGEETPSRP